MFEHFKTYFARAAGSTTSRSSNASWAESDLRSHMTSAAQNAALFIEAFYDGCRSLPARFPDFFSPDDATINQLLSRNDVPFQIQPPNLLVRSGDHEPIHVPPAPPSLADSAKELIQKSLAESERLLLEGRARQAVQELLWLLETISTAFQGLDTGAGTIEGKYFNTVVADLRRHNRGTTLDRVLQWVTALHGYLSSPTGGGVRHGTDLVTSVAVDSVEARLFCNLIRSYIIFLIAEHDRLSP